MERSKPGPIPTVIEPPTPGRVGAALESSLAGVRKPDPAVYRLACDRLGIEASEAVFLDDLGVNLKPARAMGMTTIKVTDPDAALTELETVVGFALRPGTGPPLS